MKSRYFKIALCCSILLCGCKENEEKFFDGDTTIHFELAKNQLDSMVYSFTNTAENFITANLPVQIAGYADRDYIFKLKIDVQQTTAQVGKHYEAIAESYTIKSGTYKINIPVKLLLSDDLNDGSVRLSFTIEPVNFMVGGISYLQKAVIVSTNDVANIDEEDWEYYYYNIFGEYSRTKHRYILSVLKLNTWTVFEDLDKWLSLSENQLNAYSVEMNNFFTNNDIIDENGNKIEPWIN